MVFRVTNVKLKCFSQVFSFQDRYLDINIVLIYY